MGFENNSQYDYNWIAITIQMFANFLNCMIANPQKIAKLQNLFKFVKQ